METEKTHLGWGTRKLNTGALLPELGWGSARTHGDEGVDQVVQAIDSGLEHIDTAQAYNSEWEVGKGIKEAGIARKDIWVTTKWSGTEGKGVQESIEESLKNLGLKYVDLYLIHRPSITNGNHIAAWTEFEAVKEAGLAKNIGVSNFEIEDLEIIREAGLSTPSVNQIRFHPYVYEQNKALLAYHATHGIVTEAYSPLTPLTRETDGPLTPVLEDIAEARGASTAAVLFAWARSKGAVIVTTSRQKDRLDDYVRAGELKLTKKDVERIDEAGKEYASWKRHVRRILAGVVTLGVATVWLRKLVG